MPEEVPIAVAGGNVQETCPRGGGEYSSKAANRWRDPPQGLPVD